jgi:hypothetical protein
VLRTIVQLSVLGTSFLVACVGWQFQRSVPALLRAQATGVGGTGSCARFALAALAVAALAVLPVRTVNLVREVASAQGIAAGRTSPWPNEPELFDVVSDISLSSGGPFRGSLDFPALIPEASNTVAAMWKQGVPTANEYSQLVTPESFYFIHVFTFLDLPYALNRFDLQCCREMPAFWAMLQMLGIRYYVTPGPLPEHVNLGFSSTTAPHRPPRAEPGTWHIYELPHPNLGDYSPTETAIAGSAAEIATILTKPGFDPTRHVVVPAPLAGPLVPARNMKLSVIRGGWHLSGHSDGTSLVVLPQQFSHCLRARAGNIRFIRANLMMAAAVFSGDIDTDIVFDYGIFSPGCRRADLADLKRLDMRIDIRAPHLSGGPLFPNWNEAVARVQAAWAAIQ